MKRVLITGASRGLGEALLKALRDHDFVIYCLARKFDYKEDRSNIKYYEIDLRNEYEIHNFCQQMNTSNITFDCIVNNAGVYLDREVALVDLDLDILKQTLEVNLYAPILLIQGLFSNLNDGAQVINLSSSYARLSKMRGNSAAYRISKVGLNAVTKILSSELKSKNIKVNSVCPGLVKTEMGGESAIRSVEEGIQDLVSLILNDHNYNGIFIRDGKEITW